MAHAMRTGVVCGIARGAGGGSAAEVVVRLSQEQWLVAQVDARSFDVWCLSVGQPVLVDARAGAVTIQPLPPRLVEPAAAGARS